MRIELRILKESARKRSYSNINIRSKSVNARSKSNRESRNQLSISDMIKNSLRTSPQSITSSYNDSTSSKGRNRGLNTAKSLKQRRKESIKCNKSKQEENTGIEEPRVSIPTPTPKEKNIMEITEEELEQCEFQINKENVLEDNNKIKNNKIPINSRQDNIKQEKIKHENVSNLPNKEDLNDIKKASKNLQNPNPCENSGPLKQLSILSNKINHLPESNILENSTIKCKDMYNTPRFTFADQNKRSHHTRGVKNIIAKSEMDSFETGNQKINLIETQHVEKILLYDDEDDEIAKEMMKNMLLECIHTGENDHHKNCSKGKLKIDTECNIKSDKSNNTEISSDIKPVKIGTPTFGNQQLKENSFKF